MSEKVNTYLIQKPETLVPMDRKDFYDEQIAIFKKTGKPTRIVDIVDILIFNTKGEILLQKRSYDKAHNAGMIDKSMGGHVQYGDAYDYTVMVETIQELHTPSIVLKNKVDFKKTFNLLCSYIDVLAIVLHVGAKDSILSKNIKRENVQIANRVHMYLGVYNGRVRPADGEAQGVLWYKLDDLNKEIEKVPETFTYDLKFFLKEYRDEINRFIKQIQD